MELSELAGNLRSLKQNWDKQSATAEQVAGYAGGSLYVQSVERSMEAIEQSIRDAQANLTRESLNKVKNNVGQLQRAQNNYETFKKTMVGLDIANVATAVFDKDNADKNIADMTRIDNVISTGAKTAFNSALPGASALFGLLGNINENLDVVGKGFQTMDKLLNPLGESAIGQAMAKGVENTVGAGFKAVSNVPITSEAKGYRVGTDKHGQPIIFWEGDKRMGVYDNDGKVLNGKEAAEHYMRSRGWDGVPDEAGNTGGPIEVTRQAHAGDILSAPGDMVEGIKSVPGEIGIGFGYEASGDREKYGVDEEGKTKTPWYKKINPLRGLYHEQKEYKELLEYNAEQDALAKLEGFAGSHYSEWTPAQAMGVENESKETYTEIDRDYQAQQQQAEIDAHSVYRYNSPIHLYAYGKQGDQNLNFYEANQYNNFDDGSKFRTDTMFHEDGRPTQELIDYAIQFKRPIQLHYTESGYGGNDFEDSTRHEPWNDSQFEMLSGEMRGIEAPDFSTSGYNDAEELPWADGWKYGDPIKNFDAIMEREGMIIREDEEGNKYQVEEGDPQSNFYRAEDGSMQSRGGYEMNTDPSHLGSNWYETDFHGDVYKANDSNWRYNAETGWHYEDENTDWFYKEGPGWLYSYTDENDNQWVYGDEQESWISYDKTKGEEYENWDWLTPKEEEPAELVAQADPVEEPTALSMADQQKAFVDDYFYNTPSSLKEYLYSMDGSALGISAGYLTDGAIDSKKMHQQLKSQQPMFNASMLAFDMNKTSSYNAWQNSRSVLESGGQMDLKSNQPNLDLPTQDSGSGDSQPFNINTQQQQQYIPKYNNFVKKTFGYDYTTQSA